MSQTEEWQVIVSEAVADAMQSAEADAKHEAGKDHREVVQPLLLGPQCYRDPGSWSPNYRLRGAPLGGENDDETVAKMRRVPLTQDERFDDVLNVLQRVDDKLGWPGDS